MMEKTSNKIVREYHPWTILIWVTVFIICLIFPIVITEIIQQAIWIDLLIFAAYGWGYERTFKATGMTCWIYVYEDYK